MKYTVKYTKHALRDLKRIRKKNHQTYDKICDDLKKIQKDPYITENINIKGSKCPKCKRMKSEKHRIIYYIHTTKPIIEIVRIIKRKQNYREF